MELTVEEFLSKTGLLEPLAPGQIKYKHHKGEKPGTSYTMVYDWKTNPDKIRVEVRPGLSGLTPEKKDLGRFALWLQAPTFLEFDLMPASKTKH